MSVRLVAISLRVLAVRARRVVGLRGMMGNGYGKVYGGWRVAVMNGLVARLGRHQVTGRVDWGSSGVGDGQQKGGG